MTARRIRGACGVCCAPFGVCLCEARPAADVLADLAALAARQAELTAELARALRAPAPAPATAPESAPEYLTTREAAAVIGVSVRTLEALRAEGRGPRFVRLGRAVRYIRSELASPEQTPERSAVQLPSSAAPAAPSGASVSQ